MDFNDQISKYLEDCKYTSWSFLGALKYLAIDVKYSSADLPAIKEAFLHHMCNNSRNPYTNKSVKRKATTLCTSLSGAAECPEVQQFVQELDIRNANKIYDNTVELVVVEDKTTKVKLSGKKYTVKQGDINNTLKCKQNDALDMTDRVNELKENPLLTASNEDVEQRPKCSTHSSDEEDGFKGQGDDKSNERDCDVREDELEKQAWRLFRAMGNGLWDLRK
ncbi:3826_t:CDS:2 [Paraglomus occultum]|uniref:3826_t:CDS:1 n=1 Tax=Paraglomus occultum TaxID=144539 RepID=A0A9N9AM63_9GLOM|nr:3826_t:CDS:2 [Paraglomus occultum]